MPESPADHGRLIEASCRESEDALAEAFSRAFEAAVKVAVTATPSGITGDWQDRFGGPGLLLVFELEEGTGVAVLPNQSGVLPESFSKSDDSDTKLLATRLAECIFPTDLHLREVRGTGVADVAAELQRAGVAADACLISIDLRRADAQGSLYFFWPGTKLPSNVASPETTASYPVGAGNTPATESHERQAQSSENINPGESTTSESTLGPQSPDPGRRQIRYTTIDEGIRQLPTYSQSLLKIKVPVTVTLATAKRSVSSILDIGPGAIIQFQKSCDDALSLEVGNRSVAEGEAVKVGDKFGLWVTSIKMPEERFWSVRPSGDGPRVQ